MPLYIKPKSETLFASDYGVSSSASSSQNVSGLRQAITAASGGAIIDLPVGNLSIDDTITVDKSNILLRGYGADGSHDVGTQAQQAATRLTWAGAGGGTMLAFASPTGASAQKMRGGGLHGIYFKASGAGTGLSIKSWASAKWDDLHFEEFTTAGISIGCVSTLGEAKDSQSNIFQNISSRIFTNSGDAIVLDGVSDANTSMNLFENIDLSHKNGDGFSLKNSDNNFFLRCRAFRASAGTGRGVVFHGSNTSGLVARYNLFHHLTAYDITALGTATYTYPSFNNAVHCLDSGNGVVAPTVETGSSCAYSFTDGRMGATPLLNGVSGENKTSTDYGLGGTASHTIVNDSSAHLLLATTGNVKWIQRINNGDIDFTLNAGAATAALRAARFRCGTATTDPIWQTGNGSPEGVVTAPVGSVFSRKDGGAGTSYYVKESGTGNTGWVAK